MAPPSAAAAAVLAAIWCCAAVGTSEPGSVGCLFSKSLCDEETEWCYDDYAFGKCLPQHGPIDNDSFFRYSLLRPALHSLQREMERLLRQGYRWSHAYTQCVLQALLADVRSGTGQFHRSQCDSLADQDLEAALKVIEGDEQEQLDDRSLARVTFTPSANDPHPEFADEVYFPPLGDEDLGVNVVEVEQGGGPRGVYAPPAVFAAGPVFAPDPVSAAFAPAPIAPIGPLPAMGPVPAMTPMQPLGPLQPMGPLPPMSPLQPMGPGTKRSGAPLRRRMRRRLAPAAPPLLAFSPPPPPQLFAVAYNTPNGFRHGQETRDMVPPPPQFAMGPRMLVGAPQELMMPDSLLMRNAYENAFLAAEEQAAEQAAQQAAEQAAEQAAMQAAAAAAAEVAAEAEAAAQSRESAPVDPVRALQALQQEEEQRELEEERERQLEEERRRELAARVVRRRIPSAPPPPPPQAFVDLVQRRTPELLQEQLQPPPPPPQSAHPLPDELRRAAELLMMHAAARPPPPPPREERPAGYSEGGLVFAPPANSEDEDNKNDISDASEGGGDGGGEDEAGKGESENAVLEAGLDRLLDEYAALGLGFKRRERLDVKKPGPPFATNNYAFRQNQEGNQVGQLEEMQPLQQPSPDASEAPPPSVSAVPQAAPPPAAPTDEGPREEEGPEEQPLPPGVLEGTDIEIREPDGDEDAEYEPRSVPQKKELNAPAPASLLAEPPPGVAYGPLRYEHVDTSYVYIKFKDRSIHNWQDGKRLVAEVARQLGLEPTAFSNERVDNYEVAFKVENNSRGLNASDVAGLIDGIKGKLHAKFGVEVTSAGVGNKTKLPPVLVAVADARREVYVVTFLVCGALAATLVAAAVLLVVRRHARSRRKLRELGARDSEASKDYQELCRAHMATKAAQEKPEPVHVGQGQRIASLSKESEASNNSPSSRSSTSSWSEEPALTNMDISTGHMVLSYMEDHLKNKDRLDQEWIALCAYEAEPCATTIARKSDNIKKNRNSDFLPYDHSRVVLNDLTNISGSDYINASTITDHDPRNPAYIATQGPLLHTAPDFWQMVWEQGSVVMVMLTRLTEAGISMCHRYWPEEGSELYHIYEVHLVSEHIWCDDYLVRSFYLKNLKTGETRTVTQFHFLSWPDAGVPSSTKALLEFRRKVNKSYRGRSCPIVVHCSDGVGRTGTYCLIDMVLNRMAKGAKEIDIAATLEHIRDQRPAMVRTKQQFEFCLMAVAEEVHAILKALPTQQQSQVQPPALPPPPSASQPQLQQPEAQKDKNDKPLTQDNKITEEKELSEKKQLQDHKEKEP